MAKKDSEMTASEKAQDKMEGFLKRLENMLEKQLETFEAHPLRTSIIFLLILFAAKKAYTWIKEA